MRNCIVITKYSVGVVITSFTGYKSILTLYFLVKNILANTLNKTKLFGPIVSFLHVCFQTASIILLSYYQVANHVLHLLYQFSPDKRIQRHCSSRYRTGICRYIEHIDCNAIVLTHRECTKRLNLLCVLRTCIPRLYVMDFDIAHLRVCISLERTSREAIKIISVSCLLAGQKNRHTNFIFV